MNRLANFKLTTKNIKSFEEQRKFKINVQFIIQIQLNKIP